MSTVKFLSEELAGFRAFSESKPGILHFQDSLSVIVGANGSGKSTLVEVLRYAMTGDMPVGSNTKDSRGHPFVNDPGFDLSSSKAYVKVEFLDLDKRKIRIDRSLRIYRKAKTFSLKSEPAVIHRYDEVRGQWDSLSNKILDTNSEVSQLLGVRPAILKYVVFCTQDDSLWPMSEPRALMEKFEDIFDSKRYRLLIKAFHEVRKEKGTELREMKVALEYIERDKKDAETKRSELRTKQENAAKLKAQLQSLRDRYEPLKAELERLDTDAARLTRLSLEVGKLQSDLDGKEKLHRHLSEGSLAQGTAEELRKELASFENAAERRRKRVEELEMDKEEGKRKATALQHRHSEKSSELASLKAKAGLVAAKARERDEAARSLEKEMGIVAGEDEISLRRFQERVGRRCEDWREELEKAKGVAQATLESLRSEVEEANSQLTALQTKAQLKDSEAAQKRRELEAVRRKLSGEEGNRSRLKCVEQELALLRDRIAPLREGLDEKDHEAELAKLRAEKESLDVESRELERKVKRAQEALEDRTALGLLNAQVREKEMEADEKPLPRLRRLLRFETTAEPEPEHLIKALEEEVKSAAEKRRQAEEAQTRVKTEAEEAQRRLDNLGGEIEEKENQLRLSKERLLKGLGPEGDLVKELESLTLRKEELAQQRGALSGKTALLKEFKAEVEKEKACPLCQRGVDDKELCRLSAWIQQRLDQLPTEKKIKAEEAAAEECRERLESLRPHQDSARHLSQTLLPQLRKERAQTKAAISASTKELQLLKTRLEAAVSCSDEAAELSQAFVGWPELCAQLQRLRSAAAEKTRQVGSAERLDLRQVQASLSRSNANRQTVEEDIQTRSANFFKAKKELLDMESEENRLSAQLNEIREALAGRSGLAEKESELDAAIAAATNQAQTARQQILPLEQEIQALKQKLSRSATEANESEKKKRKELEDFSAKAATLSRLRKEWKELQDEAPPEREDSLRQEIQRLNEECDRLSVEAERLSAELYKAKTSAESGEAERRAIDDALKALALEEEMSKLRQRLSQAKADLGPLANLNIEVERQRRREEVERLGGEISKLNSSAAANAAALTQLQTDLAGDKYGQAQQRYNHAIMDRTVKEKVLEDCVKVVKIREEAMRAHHKAQMKELNQVLEQLWDETYSGSDISAIRIATESEGGKGTSISEGGQAKYSYSVQMRKGDGSGAWLDMRQRCSAGQKVLACLLIRLALAEIFADRCGFLVLDEPTTNIDDGNASRLATSLARLVHRKNQGAAQRFQLLLITHDKGFVEQLIHNHPQLDLGPSKYIHLSKDHQGHSKICELPSLNPATDSQQSAWNDDGY